MGILDFFFGKKESTAVAPAPQPEPRPVLTGPGQILPGVKNPSAQIKPEVAAEASRMIEKKNSLDRLKGTIPEEVRSGGDIDEITEAIMADAGRRAEKHYASETDAPAVPKPLRSLINTTGQFIEGGGSAFGDLFQGALRLGGVEGKAVEPVTNQQVFNRYREFIGKYAPDRVQEFDDVLDLEGYSPGAQTAGALTEVLGEGFVTGSLVTRSLRGLPAIQKLRSSGRTGVYLANILENTAASVGVNVEYGATRGMKPQEIARSIAANPSVLLPLNSKLVVALGGVADYFAAKTLGFSTQDALVNAALNAGSNLAQRQGMKSELADVDIGKIKGAFLQRFKGPKELGEAVWNEAQVVHSYARANPLDVLGIEKMQVAAERRLLKLHKDLQKAAGTTAESRLARKTGPESPGEPRVPPDAPTSKKTPQGMDQKQAREIAKRAYDMDLEEQMFLKGSKADLGEEYQNAEATAGVALDLIKDNDLRGFVQKLTGKKGYAALEGVDDAGLLVMMEKIRNMTPQGSRANEKINQLFIRRRDDVDGDYFQEILQMGIDKARGEIKSPRKNPSNAELSDFLDRMVREGRVGANDEVEAGVTLTDLQDMLLGKNRTATAPEKQVVRTQAEAVENFDRFQTLEERIFGQKKGRTAAQKIGSVKGGTKRQVREMLRNPDPADEFAPAMKRQTDEITKQISPYPEETPFKDIIGLTAENRDFPRNVEAVFGEGSPEAEAILRPWEDAKKSYVDMEEALTNELDTEIVKKLGIEKGSKLSAEVQKYGELPQAKDKAVKYKKLVEKYGQKKADSVVAADAWFRKQYDALLDKVNASRRSIYGNNPKKLIEKRANYYRHFQEMQDTLGYESLINAFETPAGISPELSGLSAETSPKSKFLSIKQRRFGEKTETDAVGGFLNYVRQASYAVNIDPQTARIRALRQSVIDRVGGEEGSPHLNRFIHYLYDYANDLAGKTSKYDRPVQDIIGRRTLRVLDWLNKRAKANAVVGNVSSSVAQVFNIPQGIASAKAYSVPGAARTLADILVTNEPSSKSPFLRERYLHNSLYSRFEHGMLQDARKFAVWMTGVGDEVGTKFIWNSHYYEGKAKGVEDAIRYADRKTRAMVAGRGVGEVPLIHKSKVMQIVAPFQLEVGNLWWVMGDQVSKKQFGSLAALFVANYLMNQAAEKIRGSGVVFDPIQAGIDIVKEDDPEAEMKERLISAFGRAGGEVLGNLPFGQTVVNAVFTEEQKKKFFGKADIARYGAPLVLGRSLQNPLYRILPPFGGAQAEKTVKGVKLLKEGGQLSQSEKTLLYPSPDKGDIMGKIQALLFGPSATEAAKDYYEDGARGYYRKVGGGKPPKPERPSRPSKP